MIFDPIKIVEDHYGKTSSEENRSLVAFYMFALPLSVSLLMAQFSISINSSSAISYIAIIVGFLINCGVLLITQKHSKGTLGNKLEDRVISNIFYSILVGLAVAVVLVINWGNISYVIQYKTISFDIFVALKNMMILHFTVAVLAVTKALYGLYS